MPSGRPKKGETGYGQRIMELTAKGVQPAAIAVRLGITRDRVVKLITAAKRQEEKSS